MKTNLQQTSLPIELAASDAAADGWVMLFPAGKNHGYDGRGPYVLGSDMQAVIAASMRPRVDLPIDRDHAIDLLPKGAPKPAAGWIKEMQARADGIYARVEWTPHAAQQIADKEYRYLSPVFYYDRATGLVTRILRAGLVNEPNLEVKAVAAAETQPSDEENKTMDDTLKAIAALLGLDETAEPAAILEAVKALKGDIDVVKETVDAPAEATGEEIVEKIEEKIEAETAAAKKKAELAAAEAKVDPKKYVPKAMYDSLATRVQTLETASAQSRAEIAVDQAMKAGKIAPAQKDWALSYASSDLQEFEKFVKGAPVVVKPGADDKLNIPETAAALDDDQKDVCKSLGISTDAFVKTAKSERA